MPDVQRAESPSISGIPLILPGPITKGPTVTDQDEREVTLDGLPPSVRLRL